MSTNKAYKFRGFYFCSLFFSCFLGRRLSCRHLANLVFRLVVLRGTDDFFVLMDGDVCQDAPAGGDTFYSAKKCPKGRCAGVVCCAAAAVNLCGVRLVAIRRSAAKTAALGRAVRGCGRDVGFAALDTSAVPTVWNAGGGIFGTKSLLFHKIGMVAVICFAAAVHYVRKAGRYFLSQIVQYNQLDKAWCDYPYRISPSYNGTIGFSGCGITAAAMVISSLTPTVIKPPAMADYSVQNGFRVDGQGTLWGIFPALSKKYNLPLLQTTSLSDAMRIVSEGGLVVCSVYGRPTGLFSTSGHFIVLSDVAGNECEFCDPNLTADKYKKSFRVNKARVSGNRVYVTPELAKPELRMLFCFQKKLDLQPPAADSTTNEDSDMIYKRFEDVPLYGQPVIKKLLDAKFLQGDGAGNINLSEDMLRVFVVLERMGRLF